MKLKHLLLSALAAICLTGPALAQNVALSPLPAHPRIMLFKGEDKALLRKINQDAYWKRMHEGIIAEAGRIIDLPLSERVVTGRRLLSVSRENLRRIFYLSYAYRMTNDKKFLTRAEAEMLKIAGFIDWNPSHYLDVGEMTMAMAIGYDWLYDKLSSDSRETIRTAIIEKGLKTSLDETDRNNWWIVTTNNWGQVCHAGITFGAMAVYENEPEMAQRIIRRAIDRIPVPMHEYAPDGAYPEGIGYWSYGTSFNVMLLSLIEKVYGHDFGLVEKSPGFLNTGLYSQHMVTPAYYLFNYADNGGTAGFNSTVLWFFSKTQNPALLYLQKRLFERDARQRYLHDRLLPAAMLWGAGSDASLANPTEPTTLSWMGQGPMPVMAARSNWSDSTALYFGFKGGSPSVNHAHMDVGSFIIEADGVRWAYDFGSESYDRLERVGVDLWNGAQESQRWDVFRYRTQAHNTLTFNDKPQLVKGYAKIDDYAETPGLIYAMSDLSQMYSNQVPGVKRAVAMVDKRYVVVQDQITVGRQFTKVRWNVLTDADRVTPVSENMVLAEKNGKKLYVKVECPVPIRFYTEGTTPTNSYDSPNRGNQLVGFEADLQVNTTQEIRVYFMPREEVSNTRPGYQFK